MTHFEFPAMGTTIEVWSQDGQSQAVREWFEHVEEACSRFRPESDLSRLNRDPSPAVTVGGILHTVIRAGSRALALTEGLVDIGVGSAVKAWGYDRSFETVTDLASPPGALDHGAWRLENDVLNRAPGVSLDLGGIAKGWSSDRAVEDGLAVAGLCRRGLAKPPSRHHSIRRRSRRASWPGACRCGCPGHQLDRPETVAGR